MGLTKYKEKRDFRETPEPTGGKPDSPKLRFVIQKHAASHLHYDFRLEMEGVLKSWAVPKGPSTDPEVKRLAMMVEDHPYDYRNFEGIIPSGYGAGTVIIWDEGFYEIDPEYGEAAMDKRSQEKALLKQLHAGKLKFVLHGKKLKGSFALVKAFGRGENSWLLIKHKDKYASKDDITKKEKSVVSGKTLEQVAATSKSFWESGRKKEKKKADRKPERAERAARAAAGKKKAPAKKRVKKAAAEKPPPVEQHRNASKLLAAAPKLKFPTHYTPMLATLVDKPVSDEGWVYEVKWDGYRALAFLQKGKAALRSRNNKSFDDKFYPVYDAVKQLGIDAVLDGEIVVVKENGISSFNDLQNWRSEADGDLIYYIFDLLWYDGKDLTGLTLAERRAILEAILPQNEVVRLSGSFAESGTDFFEAAKKLGLEGIIAKKADSLYYPGNRSKEWLKIKANKRQEVVIGGYTINEDTSKPFSALLVGVFEKGELIYCGKIGTGFNQKVQEEMLKQFKKLETRKPPFAVEPDYNKPSRFRPNPPHAEVFWVKPELVCEVSYTEMTPDGIMRHPSFQGMRMDKNARDVHRDVSVPTEKVVKEVEAAGEKDKPLSTIVQRRGKRERKTLLNPTEETQVKKINGHELKFTNLSKIFWPQEKVTKRDMINYYYQVAPYILPYLKGRPQTLYRHPNGIKGESFYQKDVTGKAPDWIETYLYHSEADNRDRNYLVATDEASLLYMASLACIEMNPWSSTVDRPDHPDWCIIDLDPDKNPFDEVVEAALVTKAVLDDLGIPGYCKTSGSSGMHIYIPLGAKYTYEQSKEFARVLVTLVHEQIPEFTSIERLTSRRKGKMYLDFLQNRPQATVAAPYALRPKPGAPVSMPLHWEEVKKGMKIADYNIFNAIDRLKNEGDLFKPVLGKGIDMEKIVKKFR